MILEEIKECIDLGLVKLTDSNLLDFYKVEEYSHFDNSHIGTFKYLKSDWYSFINRTNKGSNIKKYCNNHSSYCSGKSSRLFLIHIFLNGNVSDMDLDISITSIKTIFKQSNLLGNFSFKLVGIPYMISQVGSNYGKLSSFQIVLLSNDIN